MIAARKSNLLSLRSWGFLSLALAVGWSAWIYVESRPHQLVTRSALRNHKALLAENSADAPAPKHSVTSARYVVWKDLPPDLKPILAPLERRWDYLSANQRRSVLASASRYPGLTEEQQIRFTSRLVEWTKLTGKDRREMRARYKAFRALPPEQQEAAKRSWFEDQGKPSAGNGLRPTSFGNS